MNSKEIDQQGRKADGEKEFSEQGCKDVTGEGLVRTEETSSASGSPDHNMEFSTSGQENTASSQDQTLNTSVCFGIVTETN